ncbi:TPM domain-containing protein [Microbacterium sp. HD4P20]|uniref:TPM domain-containing protein n=1 Tax=Microbacterium sp. HD4P20 TaxID=2864874 RepID=UPI001C644BAF|nr:TPM domain-containing protein [Microbacterium sp. HD4P20]MCP2635013.1 TPM domain-containing protein [Microbacterium sp. HD4P20]
MPRLGRLAALRAVAAGIAVLGFAAFGPATAASAEEPLDLDGSHVTDTTGTLVDAELDRIHESLDALFDRTGESLSVVVTETFANPRDPAGWADETAALSGLGAHDVLLAIAIDDRNYAYSVDSAFALSNDDIDDAVNAALVPALRDDRWADGITAFSSALADRLDPPFPVVPVAIGAVVFAGLGGWIVLRATRPAREAARARREAARDRAERTEDANAMLVATDDAIKTSTQELAFAVAQFGDEVSDQFAKALADAHAKVTEAFTLRASLDDVGTDATGQVDETLTRIVSLCEQADAALDDQAAAFEALRDIEKHAPQLVEQLHAQREGIPSRIGAAEASLAALAAAYGSAAVTGSSDSIARARKLVLFLEAELDQASGRLAAGRAGEAAVDVRAAQQAAGQIDQLLASVETLETSLPALSAALTAAVDDTRADIGEAESLAAEGTEQASRLAPAVAAARSAIAGASDAAPADALSVVEAANTQLSAALAQVRSELARRARAVEQLPRAIESAQQALAAASGYITARRAMITYAPRSRLADAENALAAAMAAAASNPERALEDARRAREDALRADRIARNEVNPPPDDDDGWATAAGGGIWGSLFDSSGSSSSRGSSDRSGSFSWGGGSSRRSSRSSSSRRSSGSRSRSSSRRSGGSGSRSRRSGGGRF